MYLSINDAEINKRKQEVLTRNKQLINKYNSLSFFNKLFSAYPLDEITANWNTFTLWMYKRIGENSGKVNNDI